MRECHETNERDALPLLLQGQLAAQDAARVRAHVASCASCAEELALLERAARMFTMATPRVDVAAIVAKLPAPAARPALTVSRGGGRSPMVSRSLLAAAASLTLVATLSFAALKGRVFGNAASDDGVVPDTAVPVATVPVAMVGGAELSDLGSAELEALLAELDRMEATVAADPMAMQRAVVNAPEDL